MMMVLVKIRKNNSKILSCDPKATMTYGTNHCGKQFFFFIFVMRKEGSLWILLLLAEMCYEDQDYWMIETAHIFVGNIYGSHSYMQLEL